MAGQQQGNSQLNMDETPDQPQPSGSPTEWFALHTRSRHEKAVETQLHELGFEVLLPLSTQTRRWSDRTKVVKFPLFPGYVFVRLAYHGEQRVQVLRTHGAVRFVGTRGIGTPIPDSQMDAVRRIANSGVPAQAHPFLKVGQRVRIRGGALEGVEGILTAVAGERNLVVSVEPIERSVSIRLQGYDVEVV